MFACRMSLCNTWGGDHGGALVQVAIARAEVALDAAVLQRVPVLRRHDGWQGIHDDAVSPNERTGRAGHLDLLTRNEAVPLPRESSRFLLLLCVLRASAVNPSSTRLTPKVGRFTYPPHTPSPKIDVQIRTYEETRKSFHGTVKRPERSARDTFNFHCIALRADTHTPTQAPHPAPWPVWPLFHTHLAHIQWLPLPANERPSRTVIHGSPLCPHPFGRLSLSLIVRLM
jgi:hypothetical protein